MKSLKKLSGFILILSSMLLSCQKEFTIEDELDPPVDPPVAVDSIYLDQIVELDSISPTQFDTAYVTKYQYDASKRVIAYRQYWDEGNGMALMDEYLYVYNGTDTLPAKCTNYMYDYSAGGSVQKDTTVTFYTYSGGRLMKDSAIYTATYNSGGTPIAPTDTTVITYTYSASQITSKTINRDANRYNPGTVNVYFGRDTATLDSRGNVLTSKDYSSFDEVTWDLGFSSTFTYDNKPSPFSKISNFKALYVTAPPESQYYEMQTPNNRTSYIYDYGSGTTQEREYSGYIYRSDGLPTSCRFSEPGTAAELVIKFIYKTL